MNFFFVPPLQSMAATQIVTRLYNQADVVALIAKCDDIYRVSCWRTIEERVNEKVSLLRQPAPLREKISSVVIPIGDQIRRWKKKELFGSRFKDIPKEFCLTSRGTVDKKRMAEAYVRDLTLPERERYRMACLYCIEWDDPVPFLGTGSSVTGEFEAYWTYATTGNATALESIFLRDTSKTPYQCAFRHAVEWGNVEAAECYFRKLTPGEREELLFDADAEFPLHFTDFGMYRFLLLHMNEWQQSELYKRRAENVLECLLTWPWQPIFMDVARRVKDTLNLREYSRLLSQIVQKIEDGYRDYSYRELFEAFWMEIPVAHKKDLLRNHRLLSELFRVMGEKNISLMMKEASPEEREDILFSEGGVDICSNLAYYDVWDSLECFIGECITSRDKIIHFKEKCEEEIMHFNLSFYKFLDELVEKCGENKGREEAYCSVLK